MADLGVAPVLRSSTPMVVSTRAGWAALGVVAAMGCGTGGALEQVEVSADCAEGCRPLGLDAPLAVGAETVLDLAVVSPGLGTPLLTVEAAVPERIEVEERTARGVGEGMSALVIATEGRVIDFVHVVAAAPDGLGLASPEGELLGPRIQLLVGDERSLRPVLLREGVPLVGTGDVAASSDGVAVIVLDEGVGARRRLVAREAGTATVSVAMAGQTTSLEVEVLP